jgi:hypothetical protein
MIPEFTPLLKEGKNRKPELYCNLCHIRILNKLPSSLFCKPCATKRRLEKQSKR